MDIIGTNAKRLRHALRMKTEPSSVGVPRMAPVGPPVAVDRNWLGRIGRPIYVIDSEHAFHTADRPAHGAADDGTDRTGNAIAFVHAMGNPAGNALRLRRDRHAQQKRADHYDSRRADADMLQDATNAHNEFSDLLNLPPRHRSSQIGPTMGRGRKIFATVASVTQRASRASCAASRDGMALWTRSGERRH
jgi:hypothetical protein